MSDNSSYFRIVADRVVDTGLGFNDKSLRAAVTLWQEKAAGRAMPARSDFSHEDLWPFMGNIALIDVEPAPLRYRYRLIGTNIVSLVDRDMSGRYLDDVYAGEKYEYVVWSFDYIRTHKVPVRGTGNISHAEKGHLRVEVLDAPLSSDGETVDMIFKVVARNESSGLSL